MVKIVSIYTAVKHMSGNDTGEGLSDFESLLRATPGQPLWSVVVDIDANNTQLIEQELREILQDSVVEDILQRNQTTTVDATQVAVNQTRLILPAKTEQEATALETALKLHKGSKSKGTGKSSAKAKYKTRKVLNTVRIPEPPDANEVVFDLPAQAPGRDLATTVGTFAYQGLQGRSELDTRDQVLNSYDWLTEVLEAIPASSKPTTYMGIMDTGISAGHKFFSDIPEMRRYTCENDIECIYRASGDPNGDATSGHGTHVAGIAASRVRIDRLIDIDVIPGGAVGILSSLRVIEKELQQLEAQKRRTGKPYIFIVNASLIFPKSMSEIAGVVSKDEAIAYNKAIPEIVALCAKLHSEYPAFRLVAAAGNQGSNVSYYYPAALQDVRAVVGHDARSFTVYGSSNYGPKARISQPSVGVLSSVLGGPDRVAEKTGTSMGSPAEAADLTALMQLMPGISSGQAIQIQDALALDINEFPLESYSQMQLRAPIANLNLNRLLEYLADHPELEAKVIPQALRKMRQIAPMHMLQNIPQSDDVISSIPNYRGKVAFNVNDAVEFSITANAGSGNGVGTLNFCLGSTYIPMDGVNKHFQPYTLFKDGTFFTKPIKMDVPRDGRSHTYQVRITRKADYKTEPFAHYDRYTQVQILENNRVIRTLTKEPVMGRGVTKVSGKGANKKTLEDQLDDVKIGISKSAGVEVLSMQPLHRLGQTAPTISATRTPTSLSIPSKAPSTASKAPTLPQTRTPTKQQTKTPTLPKPTLFPTRPSKAPTSANLPPSELAPGDCQVLTLIPPTADYTFKVKVGDRTVTIKENFVNVVEKNNKPSKGVNKYPLAVATLDPAQRYLFKITNDNNQFSSAYVPIIKKKVRGKVRFVAQGTLQEVVSWRSTANLDIAFPTVARNDVLGSDIRECSEFTDTGTIVKKGRGLSEDGTDTNRGAMFFSAAATLSSAARSVYDTATGYLAAPADLAASADAKDDGVVQMIMRGAPIALAAIAFLGLGYYALNRLSGSASDAQTKSQKTLEFITMKSSDANNIVKNLQGPEDLETGHRGPKANA